MTLPEDIRLQARNSAKSLLGDGYVDSYYDSAASGFIWMYEAGYQDAIKDQRKKFRKRVLDPAPGRRAAR